MKYIQKTGAIETTYEANTSAEIVELINAVNIPVNMQASTVNSTVEVGETV